MSGQIFISYRREESRWSARSLHDRLCQHFDRDQIFMDLDSIALGEDFVEAIETTVAKCDVLIAVIGNNWLMVKDERGGRRLDNPEDFVRMEIGTALKRKIRVIPVLVDGVLMPPSTELPEDLKFLVRRNALRITDTSFDADCQRLVATIKLVLEKAAAQEQKRLATEGRDEAISLDPNDADAYYRRGFAYFETKDYDKAISAYGEAIRLDSNYSQAYYNRALAYRLTKDNDKAISDYSEAIRLDSNDADAYYGRGLAYFEKKDYDKAISDYSETIRLDSNYAQAYYNRGLTYRKKRDNDKAISDYSEVIRLDPNDADVYYGRGLAYFEKKDYDKAISDYSETIRLDSNYAQAYYARALAFKAQRKNALAQADFDKAKRLNDTGSQ
jgi:tetratricopeptide (TPR) repeat protein